MKSILYILFFFFLIYCPSKSDSNILIEKDCSFSDVYINDDSVLKNRLEWFQDMKFGLFVHFGIYSQWGCIESWPLVEEDSWARPDDLNAWLKRSKKLEHFKRDYWSLNKTFNPVNFDPNKWAEFAGIAGMKYFVFTTKHHDGFNMYDTKQTDYKITNNSCPFSTNKRADITKEAFDAFREKKIAIGAYYSKADWHSPYYWVPDSAGKNRNPNYNTIEHPEIWNNFVEFVHNQIKEILTNYGTIDILWLDAGQVHPPEQDIKMDQLVKMARTYQPELIVVDRTIGGEHENYRTPEQEVPKQPLPYVWETCMTMGEQWSYKPNDNYKTTYQLINLLVDIVAKGGNLLLNIGPQPNGEFPEIATQRLREIGDWMKINSKAIYKTRPIYPYKDGQIAFTKKNDTIFVFYSEKYEDEGLPNEVKFSNMRFCENFKITLLGNEQELRFDSSCGKTTIYIPNEIQNKLPCKYVYVFQIAEK